MVKNVSIKPDQTVQEVTGHSTNQKRWQEVPSSVFVARNSADTCKWDSLCLKSDQLVLVLLRLPLASLRCHSARKSSRSWNKKLFRKQTEGNSQTGVSFTWNLCSFCATRSLRSRAGEDTHLPEGVETEGNIFTPFYLQQPCAVTLSNLMPDL